MPDGIILLDKPLGLSSNQALQRVRRLFGRVSAGHTGSLDPLATGMLPICIGEATKIAGLLLGGRKAYVAEITLGSRTATGDAEGEVVETQAVPALHLVSVEAALAALVGSRLQKPPMYSAVHVDGVRLYQMARRGIEVERASRTIRIDRLHCTELRAGSLRVEVTCSTGTYIRVLAEELAAILGTVGFVSELRRSWVEPFEEAPQVKLEALQAAASECPESLQQWVLPIERGLAGRPEIQLDADGARRLAQGQRLPLGASAGPKVVFDAHRRLLGLAEVDCTGILHPRRLFSWAIDSRACARNTTVERGPVRR